MRALAHAVLVRALPAVLARRFDARSAAGLDAELELRVIGPHGEAQPFTIRVQDGGCHVRPGPAGRPGVTLELSGRDLVALALRQAAWPQLLSARRLRMHGDPYLGLRFPPLFRLAA